jgi:omega-amidase
MNIVGMQMDTVWEDKAANHTKLAALLAAHPPEPGSLVVLPEMWAIGFSMNVAGISETPDNETERFLAAQAARYGIGLLGGVVTTGLDGLGRNEAVLFGPDGRETARYTKMHPFSFGTETRYYGRGSEVVLFEWQGFRVAPFICYDLRFPEVFRQAARRGAEVFCVLANWPQVRDAHWRALLEARAIENQAYVLGINRCGTDPQVAYSGHSLLFGPRGELLADAGTTEGMLFAHLDQAALRAYRRDFPVLADIHPDCKV